jgi:hypothetical protein
MKIIRLARRKQTLRYLHDILQPILEYQDKAIKFREGEKFQGAKDIIGYIHLTLLTGDTMALDYLAGTSNRKKYTKCRMCLLHNCVTPYNNYKAQYRDDNQMKNLGINGEAALYDSYKNLRITKSKEIIADLNKYNLSPGYNPLIEKSLLGKINIKSIHFSNRCHQIICIQFLKDQLKML